MRSVAILMSGIALTVPTLVAASNTAALQLVRGVHPVMAVTLDGHTPARMLIDTGAGRTVIAAGLVPRGAVVDICLTDTVCVKNLPVDTYASTYSKPQPGYYNGLIGWDILSKLVTTIDYRSAQVHFGTPGTGSRLAYSLDQWGRPQAPITIAGKPLGDMLLDTGGSYVRVTDAQSQQLGDRFIAHGQEVSLTMGAPEMTTLSAPVPVCSALVCAADVVLQRARWPAVGGAYFRNFKVTLDGPGGAFYLLPDAPGAMRNALLRFGLQLSPDDASQILLVASASPAGRAAVQTTERLLSINGKALEGLGYLGAMALLEDAGTPVVELQLQGVGSARTLVLRSVDSD